MKEMIQRECKACEAIIMIAQEDTEIEYCLACTEELDSWFDSQSITEEEIEAWYQEGLTNETTN